METQEKLEAAVNAYLTLLRNQGANSAIINQRKHFLRYLTVELAQTPEPSSANYRSAIDATLARFPETVDRSEFIAAAREFHTFWLGDIKSIARLTQNGLTTRKYSVDIQGGLIDMLEKMDRDPWARQEQPCLFRYIESLLNRQVDSAVIDIRERMLKLLLFVIRQAGNEPNAYRAGIDAMLSLFNKEQARIAFLEIAREFFCYWSEQNWSEQNGQQSTQAVRSPLLA